jgi:3-methylcrotonyl-CoA carboxylase alpha subunit
MEMNTRLQVEHPVTEMITGEDLVEWQLRVAAGEPLPLRQGEILTGGHSIEVRLCAENPANGFLPETGRIGVLRSPVRPGIPEGEEDVRLDTGVREGDEVSVFYDPMIAKLIVWGEDRAEAARRMQEALSATAILGVRNNVAFLERVVRHPAFLRGETDTAFIERHRAELLPSPGDLPAEALAAAAARALEDERDAAAQRPASPWNDVGGWRLNQPAFRTVELRLPTGETAHVQAPDAPPNGALVYRAGDALTVVTAQGRFELDLVDPFHYEPADALPDARLTALMPGRVVKVLAAAGDAVKKGQALMILEAMKMEHTLVSPRDGVIERAAFAESDMVPADAVLFTFRDT